MATHVKVVAALFGVFGVVLVAGALFSSVLFGLLADFAGASREPDVPVTAAILGLTGLALTAFLLVLALPYLVTAWGLFARRRWARVIGIILAAIALTRIPFGTIIGIYALIVLFHRDTEGILDK